jgi:hypothetical protein
MLRLCIQSDLDIYDSRNITTHRTQTKLGGYVECSYVDVVLKYDKYDTRGC